MREDQRNAIKQKFLEALKQDPTVLLACEVAGISKKTAYSWRSKSKAFAEAWDEMIERGHDVARSSIYRRGILGWDEKAHSNGQVVMEYEPVVDEAGNQRFDEKSKPLFKGGKPLMIHKWSDSLASLYAKANLPEYKEKQQIDLYQHMAGQAEQDKQSLLADLDAAITNERKKPE